MTDTPMTDAERLTQRFLDDELTGEERLAFLVRLGRDAALRSRVLELEQLALDARRLPRAEVPAAFVARVLDRAMPARSPAAAPMPWRRRAAAALVAPRTLRWNLAGAVAAAAMVALGLAGAAAVLMRAPASPGPIASSATAARTVFVRLVVVLPDANTVEVAGDFNGWDPARTPLTPAGDGVWSVTLPLEPGRYEYMFVVNGDEWMADPFAVERRADGFGSQNAVLDVRAPGAV